LYAAAGIVARIWLVGELSGGLLVGIVLAWHLREQVHVEGVGPALLSLAGMSLFLATVLAIAGAHFLIARLSAGRPGSDSALTARHLLALWSASSIAFFLLLSVAFLASDTLRWHLLRHNKMIGTAAFHLFADRVADVRAARWRDHFGSPQPAWTLEPVAAQDAGVNRERGADVVFIRLDTLRADSLEAYGGDTAWMPKLNRLAAESWLFTEVLADTSWTYPSVASFFTGQRPEEHGAIYWGFEISADSVTLAEVLKNRGYETAAFIANTGVSAASGFNRGFDVFEPIDSSTTAYARANVVTRRVAEWLSGRPAGDLERRSPLFLYVHYLDPHIPYLSGGGRDFSDSTELLASQGLAGTVSPVRSHQEARSFYREELRFLDAEMEKLLELLDRELDGPRVLLVTADHGEEFGEHDGRGHAQTLYSEVLDIPAILQVRTGFGPVLSGTIDASLEGHDFFDLLLQASRDPVFDVPAWASASARETRIASLTSMKPIGGFTGDFLLAAASLVSGF